MPEQTGGIGEKLIETQAWSEIVPTFAKLPWVVYKNRKLLKDGIAHLGKMTNWASTKVVVLGRSTVGKSMLLEKWTKADKKWTWEPPGPSRSVHQYLIRIDGELKLARVIPGETIQNRDIGLHEAFHKHTKLEGVIYVADWGHTRNRDSDIRRIQIEEHKLDTIKKLRNSNLESEIRDFQNIAEKIRESISRCGRPIWLLIAVNKVDLFIDNINKSQKYYSNEKVSKFSKIYDDLVKSVGAMNLQIGVIPISSWQESFEWNGDLVESKLNDDKDRRALFLSMFSKVNSFYSS